MQGEENCPDLAEALNHNEFSALISELSKPGLPHRSEGNHLNMFRLPLLVRKGLLGKKGL